MGEVYQARDTRLGRLVAIKFVSDEFASDRTSAERLEREARLTSLLNHPNIVTVHDVGELDGRPFIVMEFVAGQSLHAALLQGRFKPDPRDRDREPGRRWPGGRPRSGRRAPRSEAAQHHADRGRPREDRGLRHRQDESAGAGRRRSHRSAAGSTDTLKAVVGTPGYMAPEQAAGRPIDFRTDQFALGAIIYEMITGRRAFKRDTAGRRRWRRSSRPSRSRSPSSRRRRRIELADGRRAMPGQRSGASLRVDTRPRAGSARSPGHVAGSRTSRSELSRQTSRRRWRWVARLPALLVRGRRGRAACSGNRTDAPLAQARALLDRFDKQPNVDQAIGLLSAVVSASPQRSRGAHAAGRGVPGGSSSTHRQDPTLRRSGRRRGGPRTHAQSVVRARSRRAGHDQLRSGPLRRRARRSAEGGRARRQEQPRVAGARPRALLGSAGAMRPKRISARRSPLAPDDWTAHNSLGALYLNVNRLDDAVASSSACRRSRRTTRARTTISARRSFNRNGSTRRPRCTSGPCRSTRTRRPTPISARRCISRASMPTPPAPSKAPWPCPARRSCTGSISAPPATGRRRCAGARRRPTNGPSRSARRPERRRRRIPSLLTELASGYAVLALLTPGRRPRNLGNRAYNLELVEQQPRDAGVLSTLATTYEELGDR